MSPQHQILALFAGLIVVLLAASLIGLVLARRRAAAGPDATIDNLNARVRAWWVIVILIALAFAFGKAGVVLLFAFASFAALREFATLTPTRRGDHWALLAAFFIVLPVQYYLIWIDWYGLYAIFIPVYAFLLLPVVVAVRGDTSAFMRRVAEVQWGLMIAVYCVSHVPALLTLKISGFEGRNLLLLAFLIIVVQASDVLQYVWGKLYGRHKIAPDLSPSKTVEGFVGGVITATLLGGALYRITPFTFPAACGMALMICVMGFFGGIVMSAIKRDAGVKDYGHLIEGHGGMMDRVDSLSFAAPVFFHVCRFWFG